MAKQHCTTLIFIVSTKIPYFAVKYKRVIQIWNNISGVNYFYFWLKNNNYLFLVENPKHRLHCIKLCISVYCISVLCIYLFFI